MKRITNLLEFMKNPINFLDECSQKKIQEIYLGHKRFILIFDSNLAKEVLIQKSEIFVQNRTIFNRIKPITGTHGLVQLNGDKSRKSREKFEAMFAPENMAKMKKNILTNTNEVLEKFSKNDSLDVTDVMSRLVLKNAFELFLGIDFSHDGCFEIARDFQELNALCGKRMLHAMPLPLMLPTRKNRRIKFLSQRLRSQIAHALKTSKSDRVTVASLFENEVSLIDQCMTFLFAGHETTASSLSFTFLLLGQNPKYRKAIGDGDEGLALRVYKESLRLYPPAYMLAREASCETELEGMRIRKGDQIILGVKQIHYHKAYYQSPKSFNPDRFKHTVEAFLPFGKGAKSCIGEGLAYMEAITIIKAFCKSFDFESKSKIITSYPLVTLHPGGGQLLVLRGHHG